MAGPCGVAAVDLAEGNVRYDEASPTERSGVIGVIGDLLIVRDDPEGDRDGYSTIPFTEGAPGHSYSTNAPFHDATIAGGKLITLYGSSLRSQAPGASSPDWDVDLPDCCHDLQVHSGNLLLLTGSEGSTYAIDLADGDVVWRTIPPVAALGYDLRVTSVRGTVLTAATTSDVLDLLWRHPAPTTVEHESAPTAALTSDTVVVQPIGSTATALDRTTGQVLWDGREATSVVAAGP